MNGVVVAAEVRSALREVRASGVMVALAALVACAPEHTTHDGTAVGNPGNPTGATGKLAMVGDDAPDDAALSRADAHVADVALVPCGDGAPAGVTLGTVDLLAGGDDVDLPGGEWCGAHVLLAEPGLELEGTTGAGSHFVATLNPPEAALGGVLDVDGDRWLLTVDLGFVDASAVDALGGDVVIGPDDDLGAAWGASASDGEAIWRDADDDGVLGPDDVRVAKAGAVVDTGAGSNDYAAHEAACGCQSGGSPLGGAGGALIAGLVALAAAATRRRSAARALRQRCEASVRRTGSPAG